MKPIQQIIKLNQNRYGLTFNPTSAISKLEEELDEFKKALKDDNEYEKIDALLDICVVAIGEVAKLGYNAELCLKQTVKEISSRRQDPKQKAQWELATKQPGEKWQKDKSQDPDTMYKADYSTCKLKSQ